MHVLGMFPFFESPGDVGGGDPAPPADPAAGAADPAVTPAADAWTGPGQEDWQRVTSFIEQSAPTLGMLGELLNDPSLQNDPNPPQQLDPADPASVQQYLDSQVEALFNERVAPFQPLLGQIAEREGEAAARSRLDQLAGTVGDFDRDQALVTAQVLLSQGLQPDQALEQAARRQFAFEEKFRTAAIEQYTTTLNNAATAVPGLPAGGNAATEGAQPLRGRDRYEVAMERGLSRLHPVNENNIA